MEQTVRSRFAAILQVAHEVSNRLGIARRVPGLRDRKVSQIACSIGTPRGCEHQTASKKACHFSLNIQANALSQSIPRAARSAPQPSSSCGHPSQPPIPWPRSGRAHPQLVSGRLASRRRFHSRRGIRLSACPARPPYASSSIRSMARLALRAISSGTRTWGVTVSSDWMTLSSVIVFMKAQTALAFTG